MSVFFGGKNARSSIFPTDKGILSYLYDKTGLKLAVDKKTGEEWSIKEFSGETYNRKELRKNGTLVITIVVGESVRLHTDDVFEEKTWSGFKDFFRRAFLNQTAAFCLSECDNKVAWLVNKVPQPGTFPPHENISACLAWRTLCANAIFEYNHSSSVVWDTLKAKQMSTHVHPDAPKGLKTFNVAYHQTKRLPDVVRPYLEKLCIKPLNLTSEEALGVELSKLRKQQFLLDETRFFCTSPEVEPDRTAKIPDEVLLKSSCTAMFSQLGGDYFSLNQDVEVLGETKQFVYRESKYSLFFEASDGTWEIKGSMKGEIYFYNTEQSVRYRHRQADATFRCSLPVQSGPGIKIPQNRGLELIEAWHSGYFPYPFALEPVLAYYVGRRDLISWESSVGMVYFTDTRTETEKTYSCRVKEKTLSLACCSWVRMSSWAQSNDQQEKPAGRLNCELVDPLKEDGRKIFTDSWQQTFLGRFEFFVPLYRDQVPAKVEFGDHVLKSFFLAHAVNPTAEDFVLETASAVQTKNGRPAYAREELKRKIAEKQRCEKIVEGFLPYYKDGPLYSAACRSDQTDETCIKFKDMYATHEDECFVAFRNPGKDEDGTLRWMASFGMSTLFRGVVGLDDLFESAVSVPFLSSLTHWSAKGNKYLTCYEDKAACYAMVQPNAGTAWHVSAEYVAMCEYDVEQLARCGELQSSDWVNRLIEAEDKGEWMSVYSRYYNFHEKQSPCASSVRSMLKEMKALGKFSVESYFFTGILKELMNDIIMTNHGWFADVVLQLILFEEAVWQHFSPRNRQPGKPAPGLVRARLYHASDFVAPLDWSIHDADKIDQRRTALDYCKRPHFVWNVRSHPDPTQAGALVPVSFVEEGRSARLRHVTQALATTIKRMHGPAP
jgi:hypothetical protein